MIKVYWLYREEADNIYVDGYIGVTSDQNRRFRNHRKRFGEFKFKIIFTGNVDQCLAFERQLRPKPGIGWNEACGGANGYRASKSEAVKIKLRLANVGQKRSEETISKIKLSRQNMSPEWRANIGAAAKGRKHTSEAKAKVIAALTGRFVSEETKAKIAASLKGRKYSKERCQNMSKGQWDKKNFHIDASKVIMLETMAMIDANAEAGEKKE